jgi:tRNA dimethylallyltransferase
MASTAPPSFSGIDLFVLTGPTAVGKTELALRWAEANAAEIVSSDSLLFYRGMDVGTAKPTTVERARVPHHLIDVADPAEAWNIGRYLQEVVKTVQAIHGRGRKVLVTGGSGFYLKSFFAPVMDAVEVPPEVILAVDQLASEGRDAMAGRLLEVDPAAGGHVDLKNPRRVRRALERCLATGRSIGELQAEMEAQSFPFEKCRRHVCLLLRNREDLEARIAVRVDQMLRGGLVEEVENLLHRGLAKNPSAASAIGYRETIRHLRGELAKEELREEIVRNTRRLVKKQLTWFRHQLPPGHRVVELGEGVPELETLFSPPD